MDPWAPSLEYWEANESACLERLKDAWNQIPVLNYMLDEQLAKMNKRLIRFRGMIQDQSDPVLFKQQYEVFNINTSESTTRSRKFCYPLIYKDDEEIADSIKQVLKEFRPMCCVSIPCLNAWANEECEKTFSRLNESLVKSEHLSLVTESTENVKMDVDSSGTTPPVSSYEAKQQPAKTSLLSESGQNTATPNLEVDPSSPVTSAEARECILNFYDDTDKEIKLNLLVEVVGFLEYNPTEESSEDGETVTPAQQIHVVRCRHLNEIDIIPTMPDLRNLTDDVHRIRKELKFVFTQLMLGDTVAAEYLILNLISRVFSYRGPSALGNFPLNITNFPLENCPSYPNLVYEVLASLLVRSHYFQLSIKSMNETKMIPSKSHETNRLVRGMLQLPAGTNLVLDETKLEVGTLLDQGVRNAMALSDIIKSQKVDYVFEYYNVDVDTDIPILVFSKGKSMLKCKYLVQLNPDPSSAAVAEEMIVSLKNYLKQHVNELRALISLAKSIDYELSDEMQDRIATDFTALRRNRGTSFTPDDLQTLVDVGRLYALSHGLSTLDIETWSEVLKLEEQRKERLSSS